MIEVVKRAEFEAAHFLPDYEGPCGNVHGHSYKIEVGVGISDKHFEGTRYMVMDFKELKDFIQEHVIEPWDHQVLNEDPRFLHRWPTAEIMVAIVATRLLEWTKSVEVQMKYPYVKARMVRIWETSGSYAEWRAEA